MSQEEKKERLRAQEDPVQDSGDANGDESQDEQEKTDEKMSAQQSQIIETGSVTPVGGKHVIHCLTIVGQIEGHYILPPQNKTTKYEHVIPQLVAIEQDPRIEGLIIILNTVGGDVEAGLAIAELIAGMKKPTVSLVLGGGHSIGVPLACSAKQSFIAPSATMTVHPVRMSGLVLGVPQTLSYFDKMQERIVNFVIDNSHISPERFRELMMNTGELVMDVGTVLDGENAVEEGLIDHLGGLSDAIGCLYDLIEEQDGAEEDGREDDKEEKPKAASRKKADGEKASSSPNTPSGNPPRKRPKAAGKKKSGEGEKASGARNGKDADTKPKGGKKKQAGGEAR